MQSSSSFKEWLERKKSDDNDNLIHKVFFKNIYKLET